MKMPSENEIQFSKDLRSIKCYALGCFDTVENSLGIFSKNGSASPTADPIINELQPHTLEGALVHVWREYDSPDGTAKIEVTVSRKDNWRPAVTVIVAKNKPYNFIVENGQDRFSALRSAIVDGIRLIAGK
jgi:hypothetical protein